MKNRVFKMNSLLALLLLSSLLFSCRDEWDKETRRNRHKQDPGPIVSVPTVTNDHPGRAMAANCFQCHGTNGYASELKIAGESSSEIIGELNEMKFKSPGANIMNVHAQAYTTEEIKLIADYFSKQ